MEQLHVGAVKSLCVVRSRSVCVSIRLINYKGVVSSVTIIIKRAKDISGKVAHIMNIMCSKESLSWSLWSARNGTFIMSRRP